MRVRKGILVRTKTATEAVGSAVVVMDRVVTYLRGNGVAPASLRLLAAGVHGRVLGTRPSSRARGRVAIVQFDEGVAAVLVADLESAGSP